MEQSRQVIVKWLHKAIEELPTGEEMLFPAETKPDQKAKRKMFTDELIILNKIDPVAASELKVTGRFRDHRYWIVIKKIAFSPYIAFKKDVNGNVERVVLDDDTEKLRRLSLMKEDGYTVEKIMEIEGDSLTKEDIEFLKRERR